MEEIRYFHDYSNSFVTTAVDKSIDILQLACYGSHADPCCGPENNGEMPPMMKIAE